jgi:hypothetical protein
LPADGCAELGNASSKTASRVRHPFHPFEVFLCKSYRENGQPKTRHGKAWRGARGPRTHANTKKTTSAALHPHSLFVFSCFRGPNSCAPGKRPCAEVRAQRRRPLFHCPRRPVFCKREIGPTASTRTPNPSTTGSGRAGLPRRGPSRSRAWPFLRRRDRGVL